jgi:CRISPR/Cas system-associated exonuclease Cas4 (RecB family)
VNKIKTFNYSSVLGWSVSRYDRFCGCKKQYFYDYYPKYDKDIPVEKIQFLRALTSKALEAGNITHDIIRDMLKRFQKNSKPINKEKFFKYALELNNKYCQAKTFLEHYYNGEIIIPSEIYAKVENSLKELLNSEVFEWVQKASGQSEDWIIEPDGFGETRIGNLKAYCKVDFLFPLNDNIYIFDWKTGKPDEKKHSRQLTGYSLWASYHFEKDASKIFPAIVYLSPSFSKKEIVLDEEILADFTNTVEKETQEMYEYLTDIENNIPKSKKEFGRKETKLCNYCCYREICKG